MKTVKKESTPTSSSASSSSSSGVEEPPHTFPTQTNHIGRMRFRVNVDCIMAFNSQPHKRFQNMRLAMTLRVAPCSSEPCKGNKLVHSQVSQFPKMVKLESEGFAWIICIHVKCLRQEIQAHPCTSHFADLCHVFGVSPLALPLAVLLALQELQADQQAVAHSAPPEQLWEQDTLVTNSRPT